jgi:hypothetical protein
MRHLQAWGLVLLVALGGCAPALDPVAPKVASSEKKGAPTPVDEILAEGFVAVGQRDGVTVYERDKLPGFELAAEGDIPAAPDRILRVLLDYPAHRTWEERLVECTVLGKGEGWLDVYERLGLPIIQDRDYTLHVTWGDDHGVLWTKFATANQKGPAPVDGVVRVHAHQGGWRLAPAADGTSTHAFYRFHLDLDSSMTSTMGTGQAENDLVQLFATIRSQLPKYP